MHYLSLHSIQNLAYVETDLVRVVVLGIQYSPIDFGVNEGRRSPEKEKAMVLSGRSETMRSKHLLQPDGYVHAVDLVAMGDLDGDGDVDAHDKARTWDIELYGQINEGIQKAARELKVRVRWGGDWRTLVDGPHFELIG